MIENLPKLIAHRGASMWAPENTLTALSQAHAMGATWVECDVMLTQDGAPIIFHDEKLNRTTNGKGLVSEHTLSEIELLNAGVWFGEGFNEEGVPTLRQWLELAAQLNMGVNLELKGNDQNAESLAKVVHEGLAKYWSDDCPTPLISSGSFACLRAMRAIDPHAQLGLISDLWRDDWRQVLQTLGCVSWHVEQHDLGAEQVAAITNAGYAALAFTVNEMEHAEKLLQWGATSVFSDNPQLLD